jgi:hypothetical protein
MGQGSSSPFDYHYTMDVEAAIFRALQTERIPREESNDCPTPATMAEIEAAMSRAQQTERSPEEEREHMDRLLRIFGQKSLEPEPEEEEEEEEEVLRAFSAPTMGQANSSPGDHECPPMPFDYVDRPKPTLAEIEEAAISRALQKFRSRREELRGCLVQGISPSG